MLSKVTLLLFFSILLLAGESSVAQDSPPVQVQTQPPQANGDWAQWRGPNRDGILPGSQLPDSLADDKLKKVWSFPMGPSYSGPLVVGERVYVTETKDKRFEVVKALDRKTGRQVWSTQWEGSLKVPFFAASNGSWIRATPAYDDGRLYVAGMRDVLVCLNAADGKEIWKVDFPKQTGSPDPSFGFVCSPLIDGNDLYVQAGGALSKVDKNTGKIIWQALQDGGGMNGSAFSSPVIATLAGKRQVIVQTRTDICGVELESGNTLWLQPVKTFRGMNILTPTIWNDNVFTSTYGGSTQLINVSSSIEAPSNKGSFSTVQKWSAPVEGYMSSPVIVNGHSYLHLRNQRFACFDLSTGTERWRSKPFGKYASLIASGDKILALDQKGELLLIRANPEKFELMDRRKVGDDSWAHVAVSGQQIFVRNLNEVVMFQWGDQ